MNNEQPLILDAGVLTIDEMSKIKNNAPAFAARILTAKAKEQGAWEHPYYGTGYTVSSTAVAGFSRKVRHVDNCSTEFWDFADIENACTWDAFYHLFNPESNFIKNAKLTERTAEVWMPNNKNADKFIYEYGEGRMQTVTNTGYVGVFGGKEYYIVNYEECKQAYDKDGTMLPALCVELDSHEKAVPFGKDNNNDFAKAKPLHEQYDRILKENATEEELQYIVPIEYVCEIIEGTPVYNKMVPRVDLMKTKQKEIENLFNSVFIGELTEEELITKLVEMVQKTASIKGAKKEDIQALRKEIAKQIKVLDKKLKQQQAELDAEVETAIEEVNNIGFGG